MSDNGQEGGSFVFVDASDDSADKSYGSKPAHPYVFKAWEWLLERTLRRRIILSYYDKDAALAALALRTKAYRMHRWPEFGNGYGCTSFPDSHFTRQDFYCHDGQLKTYQSELLPTGGVDSKTGKLYLGNLGNFSDTVYGIYSLVKEVETLLRDYRFLAPDWTTRSDYRVEATLSESTSGVRDGSSGGWTWTTSVTNAPYEIPSAPFFRLLADTRVDDPLVEVSVEDSEGNTRRVKLAKTITALKAPDDLYDFEGEKVLTTGYSGVNTYSILSFKNKTDMVDAGGSFEGTSEYFDSSANRTDETDAVGVIAEPVPRTSGSAVYVSGPSSHEGWLQPNVDWDGEPTWWHANGFPKGLDSLVSGKLKDQLKALSVTQPAVPPCIPHAFSFPEDGYDCLEDGYGRYGIHADFSYWPGNTLSLAATPHCVHKMLDALKSTVLQVPALFFEIVTETEESFRNERTYTSDGDTDFSWDLTESKERVSGTRTAANVLTCDGAAYEGDEWDETDTSDLSGTSSWSWSSGQDSGSGSTSWSDVSTRRETKRKTAVLRNPVAIRSTTSSVQTSARTVKDATTTGSYYDEPRTTHSDYGEEPEDKDPAEEDLMFPEWLRKWIKKATLFLAYETKLSEGHPYTSNYSDTTNEADGQETTTSYSGSGSGSRTTKAAKGVVSLGEMDLATGKFPDIDLVELRSRVDPSGGEGRRMGGNSDSKCVTTKTSKTVDGESSGSETNEWTWTVKPGAYYPRESSLFVVVEWKFDEESPEPFGEQIAERKAWLDAQKALQAARDGLVAAQDAKRSAENDVAARERELQEAQEALEKADETQPDEQASAERAVGQAQEAVDAAQRRLADANAALEEAIRTGEGVEAAQALVDDATDALDDANDALSEAQEHLRRVVEEYREMLQEAVDLAQARLNDANAVLQGAEAAIEEKEQAVESAQQDVSDRSSEYTDALRNYGGKKR